MFEPSARLFEVLQEADSHLHQSNECCPATNFRLDYTVYRLLNVCKMSYQQSCSSVVDCFDCSLASLLDDLNVCEPVNKGGTLVFFGMAYVCIVNGSSWGWECIDSVGEICVSFNDSVGQQVNRALNREAD
jgi:hypothetical protein